MFLFSYCLIQGEWRGITGDVYTGAFEMGLRHGQGKLVLADAPLEPIVGEWVYDERKE